VNSLAHNIGSIQTELAKKADQSVIDNFKLKSTNLDDFKDLYKKTVIPVQQFDQIIKEQSIELEQIKQIMN